MAGAGAEEAEARVVVGADVAAGARAVEAAREAEAVVRVAEVRAEVAERAEEELGGTAVRAAGHLLAVAAAEGRYLSRMRIRITRTRIQLCRHSRRRRARISS